MKILVTGGAGFIGSNLCENLIHEGHLVTCLDNFSTGHIENIQDLIKSYPDSFNLITGDITDLQTCEQATKGIDCILHEAALGSIPRSINNPKATNDVNIGGFLNMLIAARDNKIKRFIFASSSSIYGNNQELPKKEERIGHPLSPYALTKQVNELYAEVFNKTFGIEFIGLRYFNVFGKRQDPNGEYSAVIPLFIKKLVHHERPTINGDGSNSRDFTHIDNVILMNKLALTTTNTHAINQVYNTATNCCTNINSLFKFIKSQLVKYDKSINEILPIYGNPRIGDIAQSYASIEKAQKELGYRPITSFQKGLVKTVSWYYNYFKGMPPTRGLAHCDISLP